MSNNDAKLKSLPPKIQGFLRNDCRRRVSRALGVILMDSTDGQTVNIPLLGINAMKGRSLVNYAAFGYCSWCD